MPEDLTYLTWMVRSVCHGRHHQSDDDAARRSKQNRQYDQSGKRVDLEPAEQQGGRAVTREGDNVELAEMLGNSATEYPPHKRTPVDQGEQVRSEARCHSMRQTIVCEVEVRSPNPKNNHEQCCNLEGIGRLQEGFEQNETTLPSHRHGTNGDGSYSEQEEAQEAANTLTPRESDAWVVKEIGHDHRKDDAPDGRASRCECHGHGPFLKEVMTDNREGRCKNEAGGNAKKDSLAEEELVELSTEAGEHHSDDEQK